MSRVERLERNKEQSSSSKRLDAASRAQNTYHGRYQDDAIFAVQNNSTYMRGDDKGFSPNKGHALSIPMEISLSIAVEIKRLH